MLNKPQKPFPLQERVLIFKGCVKFLTLKTDFSSCERNFEARYSVSRLPREILGLDTQHLGCREKFWGWILSNLVPERTFRARYSVSWFPSNF